MNRPSTILNPFDLASLAEFGPMLGPAEIRAVNSQRYEMEQLSGILAVDDERLTAIGFKDLTADDFWGDPAASGSLPSPVCVEVAAQLATFYLKWAKLLNTESDLGLGGLSNLQMLAPIQPPCRLIVAVRVVDLDDPHSARLEFQAEANGTPVYSGDMLCIALRRFTPPSKPKPAVVEYANSHVRSNGTHKVAGNGEPVFATTGRIEI